MRFDRAATETAVLTGDIEDLKAQLTLRNGYTVAPENLVPYGIDVASVDSAARLSSLVHFDWPIPLVVANGVAITVLQDEIMLPLSASALTVRRLAAIPTGASNLATQTRIQLAHVSLAGVITTLSTITIAGGSATDDEYVGTAVSQLWRPGETLRLYAETNTGGACLFDPACVMVRLRSSLVE